MSERLLGRYELHDLLGKGGMARVYRARDLYLGRWVAAKVAPAQPEPMRRLEREAVALAALRHRNIVQIHDYSGPKATPAFIINELIDGITLAELVDHCHPLPESAILGTVHAIGSALSHAHALKMIHRDLKPQNVLIERAGRVVLIDFGIAKDTAAAAPPHEVSALLGTPSFMAPEQLRRERVGTPTDIFGLGALAYCLARGGPPFDHKDVVESMRRALAGQYEPVASSRHDLSDGLIDLIGACLKVHAMARPTAEDVVRRCEELLVRQTVSNPERAVCLIASACYRMVRAVDPWPEVV